MITLKGAVTHSVRPAGSLSLVADSHYATIFLSAMREVRASLDSSRMKRFNVPEGGVGIVPAGREGATIWPASRETVAIVIPPSSLLDLAEGEFDVGSFELRPQLAMEADPWALRLAGMLKAELASRQAANELYVDSLITLFGIHLLRSYSGVDRLQQQARGGLSQQNERRIRDFLAENFARKLSVAELAAVCELSPGYFIQAFTKSFGLRPYQYLMNLRLDRAEWLLTHGDLTITAVALACGFSGQSHLTASMRKYRNLTPAQLRKWK